MDSIGKIISELREFAKARIDNMIPPEPASTLADRLEALIKEPVAYMWREQGSHYVSSCSAYIAAAAIENGFQVEPLFAAPPAPAQNSWKDAVIQALIVNHIYCEEHESSPVRALADLVSWECKVALDPKVSEEASKLVKSLTKGPVARLVADPKFPNDTVNHDSYEVVILDRNRCCDGMELFAAPPAPAVADELWTGCVFVGSPPAQYKSWFDFAAAPVKLGVTIRASYDGEAAAPEREGI